MQWAIVCEVAQLPARGARGFDPEGQGRDTLFVVRRGDELRAYRNDCPHWPGSPMASRKDFYLNADGMRIACHSHGAQFERAVRDRHGAVRGWPVCRPVARRAGVVRGRGHVDRAAIRLRCVTSLRLLRDSESIDWRSMMRSAPAGAVPDD